MRSAKPSLWTLLFALISTSGFASFIPWDKENSPQLFSNHYNSYFHDLPLEGKSERTPWSDAFWADYKGGIAFRWNQEKPGIGFNYPLYSREELLRLKPSEIARLSPAEKYDIFSGHYNYPTVKAEWIRVSPNEEKWEGLCHGWTAASIEFEEPTEVTLINPDGIPVPFGSADVKALFTYLYGVKLKNQGRLGIAQLGKPCLHASENSDSTASLNTNLNYGAIIYRGNKIQSVGVPPIYQNDIHHGKIPTMDACDDVNAGAFHVVITNEVGFQKKAIAGDVDPGTEIWNQPIYAYESKIIAGPLAASYYEQRMGIAEKYIVQTRIHYTIEDNPTWAANGKTETLSVTYLYSLDLNLYGEIVGGDWLQDENTSKGKRPDFIWLPTPIHLEDEDPVLAKIYHPRGVSP